MRRFLFQLHSWMGLIAVDSLNRSKFVCRKSGCVENPKDLCLSSLGLRVDVIGVLSGEPLRELAVLLRDLWICVEVLAHG